MTRSDEEANLKARRMTPRRRMGLQDAMLIVVAFSLSLYWVRAENMQGKGISFGRPPSELFTYVMTSRNWLNFGFMFLCPLTLCLAALRFRRPRPSFRRLLKQPGLVACLASSLGFLPFASKMILEYALRASIPCNWPGGLDFGEDYSNFEMGHAASQAGLVVAGAWLTLWLGRRWQAEPSWIDLAGRFVGVGWIVCIPIQIVLEILWPLGRSGQF